jgi:Ca2+-binding EF-hand superfamily protein
MKASRILAIGTAFLLTAALASAAAPAAKPAPQPQWSDLVPPNLRWVGKLECVEMFAALFSGGDLDGNSGWFHPTQSLYGWNWLRSRYDKNKDGIITRKEFPGSATWFDRLDRDGDGELTAADFDFSEQSPLVRQERMANMLLRRFDGDDDGTITLEEWQKAFRRAASGKKALTRRDLQRMLFPPQPKMPRKQGSDGPSLVVALKGFVTGELGSLFEGPSLGAPAPNFRLPTQDGEEMISLEDFRGKKPVVLVFGSFT